MNSEKFIKINIKGWNDLAKSGKPYSNASLPEYGPYMKNEEELGLFKNIRGKKILQLGCSEGKSLEFLQSKGAKELWGLDICEEQIKKARQDHNFDNSKLFVSPMELNPGIPINYFDYVLSLYSIGYSFDIAKTINLVVQYLKKNGIFILSWIHPFFNCFTIEDEKILVGKSYNDESSKIISKGTEKVKLAQYNLKISTLINIMINSGLSIDKMIEEQAIEKDDNGEYDSPYYDKRKICACPTTLIIVAHKK